MTAGAFFAFLAVLAVSFEMTVTAAVLGAAAFWLIGHGGYSCNPDFNVSQLGVVTRWTPVKNLTFSAEVMWFHLDQKFTGAAVLGAAAPKPTTLYEFKDQDTVSFNVRAQRNF